jgi:hypothetical protein
MRMNTGMKILAGVVAATLSAGAMAQTNTGPSGTLFLEVTDTATGAQFIFDTGQSASSDLANGTSWNLATNTNSSAAWSSFTSANPGSSNWEYSVLGVVTPTSGSQVVEFTATTAQPPASSFSGINAGNAATQVGSLLQQVVNPAGGASYQAPGGAATLYWVGNSGYQNTFDSGTGMGVTDTASVGSSLGFYQVTISNPNGSRSGATSATLSETFDLSGTGVLTYGTVPLPASLLLLLSGLGLMGVLARRRPSGDVQLGGLAV